MNDQGTLLCLQQLVTTIGHQAFNHVVESIVVVIVQDNVPTIGHSLFQSHSFLNQGLLLREFIKNETEPWCNLKRSRLGLHAEIRHSVPSDSRLKLSFRDIGTN